MGIGLGRGVAAGLLACAMAMAISPVATSAVHAQQVQQAAPEATGAVQPADAVPAETATRVSTGTAAQAAPASSAPVEVDVSIGTRASPAPGETETAAPAASNPAATPPAASPTPSDKYSDFLSAFAAAVMQFLLGMDSRVWGYALVVLMVGAAIRRFLRTELAARLLRAVTDDVAGNWRLLLLGFTGIALSVASGYTTWDGMTNFTCPDRAAGGACLLPMVLSFLITFGIQGVMLIAAWLIGESFAQGLWAGEEDHRRDDGEPASSNGLLRVQDNLDRLGKMLGYFSRFLISLFLIAATIAVLAIVIQVYVAPDAHLLGKSLTKQSWRPYLIWPGIVILAITLVATILQRETIGLYVRGARVIVKNLPIWFMFFACMGTSVFFSFDSLFSVIFPKEERRRAADIRTTNQVSGIVADLGARIGDRRAQQIDVLFKSEDWQAYAGRLGQLIDIEHSAPDKIEELKRSELEKQQSSRAQILESKASAGAQLAGVQKDREAKLEEISRLKSELPQLTAEVERLKGDVFAKDSEIIGKKAEAEAEAGGVGGTLKAGKGPEYERRRKELGDLEKLKAISQSSLDERSRQLADKRDAIASLEAQIAQLDGEIGKLKGSIEVADKQLDIHDQSAQSDAGAPQLDVSGGYGALEGALAQFRQKPERAAFEAMQQHCAVLITVFDKVPDLQQKVADKGLRCDPGPVAEPIQQILALNDGLATYRERCAKPDSLPQNDTDALLAFGNTCIQTSGLAAADTALLRTQMNRAALNRDDKAHRFVVTWNAFLDGNQLAYLALAIAFAIDGLVFMSGLFGASAISSPLSRSPRASGRSASDLEATIHAALLPDPFLSARAVLEAFHPISNERGFSSEVLLETLDPEDARVVRKVLAAAAGIGAVARDPRDKARYLVRTEFTEFLGKVCSRELATSEQARQVSEIDRNAVIDRRRTAQMQRQAEAIRPVIENALFPDVGRGAKLLLDTMHPISDRPGFTQEIELARKDLSHDTRTLRAALNAGSAVHVVMRATERRDDVAKISGRETGAETKPSPESGADERRAERDLGPIDRYLIKPPFVICVGQIFQEAVTGRRNVFAPEREGLGNIRFSQAQLAARSEEEGILALPDPARRLTGGSMPEALAKALGLQPYQQETIEDIRSRGWTDGLDAHLAKLFVIDSGLSDDLTTEMRQADGDFDRAMGRFVRAQGRRTDQAATQAAGEYSQPYRLVRQMEVTLDAVRHLSEPYEEAAGANTLRPSHERYFASLRELEKALQLFLNQRSRQASELFAAIDAVTRNFERVSDDRHSSLDVN